MKRDGSIEWIVERDAARGTKSCLVRFLDITDDEGKAIVDLVARLDAKRKKSEPTDGGGKLFINGAVATVIQNYKRDNASLYVAQAATAENVIYYQRPDLSWMQSPRNGFVVCDYGHLLGSVSLTCQMCAQRERIITPEGPDDSYVEGRKVLNAMPMRYGRVLLEADNGYRYILTKGRLPNDVGEVTKLPMGYTCCPNGHQVKENEWCTQCDQKSQPSTPAPFRCSPTEAKAFFDAYRRGDISLNETQLRLGVYGSSSEIERIIVELENLTPEPEPDTTSRKLILE